MGLGTLQMSDPRVRINLVDQTKGNKMNVSVLTRLDRKYMLPAHTLVDPYTEDRNGSFYLVSQGRHSTAILCDAIVSIETL